MDATSPALSACEVYMHLMQVGSQSRLLTTFPTRPQGVCSNSGHMNFLFLDTLTTWEPRFMMLYWPSPPRIRI